jgi:ABC-type dipeptide/oligopeptide/nickel transport system permease subunit
MGTRRLWPVWVIVLLLLSAAALFAPYLAPYDPLRAETGDQFRPPDRRHWLGTDQFGRDVLSRALWGARYSLSSAALSTLIAMGLGLAIGGLAGTFGGWLDWVLMRGVDILFAFPGLLLALALVTLFGTGLWQVALAVGIALAPSYSRLVRAAVLSVRTRLFVEAARALGAGPWHVIWRHYLPNTAGELVTFGTVIYAWSLLDIAALDFLGLTGSPSIPAWGRMLNEGRIFLRVAPWIALGPGLMLTLSVFAVLGLSDAWRENLPGRGW